LPSGKRDIPHIAAAEGAGNVGRCSLAGDDVAPLVVERLKENMKLAENLKSAQ
jgi:hypothetical protein